MTDKKIKIKIGRYIVDIDKNDLILDNGSCVRVMTKEHFNGWHRNPIHISKKLFKDLKTCCFIFVDQQQTDKINEYYKSYTFTYYRFDIDRMIKNGYEVVE